MKSQGFSLLEIIIYLVIFCILAVITIPSAITLLDQSRLDRAIWTWTTHINEAHDLAIQRHETIIFSPVANNNTWTQGVVIRNETQVIKQFAPLETNFVVTWHGFPVQYPYLIFQSDGTLENENGSFLFCFKENCKKMVIAKGGKIHIERPSNK